MRGNPHTGYGVWSKSTLEVSWGKMISEKVVRNFIPVKNYYDIFPLAAIFGIPNISFSKGFPLTRESEISFWIFPWGTLPLRILTVLDFLRATKFPQKPSLADSIPRGYFRVLTSKILGWLKFLKTNKTWKWDSLWWSGCVCGAYPNVVLNWNLSFIFLLQMNWASYFVSTELNPLNRGL